MMLIKNLLLPKNTPKKPKQSRALNSSTLLAAPITNFKIIALIAFAASGCLQTRGALKQETPTTFNTPAKAPTITKEQATKAEAAAKTEDVNSEFRELYGRLESVEKQVKDSKENEYVKGLETKIQQMETKMALLETTVADLNAKAKAPPPAPTPAPAVKSKSPVEAADSAFDKKEWEDAILAYEDYRKKNPKGSEYAHATFRIGLSFQNMGLKDDAKAFFKEVVDKFPKSKEADLAKGKLKKL